MLTKKDDYRLPYITQFDHPRFEHHTKKDCVPVNASATDTRGHSFAAIGDINQFDFCYSKKSKTEDTFVRLHMKEIPLVPQICLYEPGSNDYHDDFFDGKQGKDFHWTKCPSKYREGMTPPSTDHHNFQHFAMNNPDPGAKFKLTGRSKNFFDPFAWTSDMFAKIAQAKQTPAPRVLAKSRKGKKPAHSSQVELSSNCTELPKLDVAKCGGVKRTENVCEFMKHSLNLFDDNEDLDPQIKLRMQTVKLIDDIFENICLNVSKHLPSTVSRLITFYLAKIIEDGTALPEMRNDTWKFLHQDLQTCLTQAEPMVFIVDEDFGADVPDYDDEDDDDTIITRGIPLGLARSRHPSSSFDDLDLGDYNDTGDDYNITIRRKREATVYPGATKLAKRSTAYSIDNINFSGLQKVLESNFERGKRQDTGELVAPPGTVAPVTPPVPVPVTDPSPPDTELERNLGRSGGGSVAVEARTLPRAVKEVETQRGVKNIPVLPANVRVIHTFPRGRNRIIRDASTEEGVKLFYYEEAAELEFEFNAALDAHWKIFSTVLGYCNKFYPSRKAETFPRLYNTYYEDLLEPVEPTWISSSDNEELEVVVSEFSDPATSAWLDSCLEASYIVSDSMTFRPPRPLTFMEGAERVTNYFEKVPDPEFFIPVSMQKAVRHGYEFEANAIDSEKGTLNQKMIGIPSDPGCHWKCNDADDCHKVCGASETATEDPTTFHLLHGPDGEVTVVKNPVYDDDDYGITTKDTPQMHTLEVDPVAINHATNNMVEDTTDDYAEESTTESMMNYDPYEPKTEIMMEDSTTRDHVGGRSSKKRVKGHKPPDYYTDDENSQTFLDRDIPDQHFPEEDPFNEADFEPRASREIGRTMHNAKHTSNPKMSNAAKLARAMERIEPYEVKTPEKPSEVLAVTPKDSFWHTGTVRTKGVHKSNFSRPNGRSSKKAGNKGVWNEGRNAKFHQPDAKNKDANKSGRNLKGVNKKDSSATDKKSNGRKLNSVSEKELGKLTQQQGRHLNAATKKEPSLPNLNNENTAAEEQKMVEAFKAYYKRKQEHAQKKHKANDMGRNMAAARNAQPKQTNRVPKVEKKLNVHNAQSKDKVNTPVMARNIMEAAKNVKPKEIVVKPAMGRSMPGVKIPKVQPPMAGRSMQAPKDTRPTEKVVPPIFSRSLPTFDEARLKDLFTTPSPKQLIGATTAGTTTTVAPPIATTEAAGPRKIGTGRKMSEAGKDIDKSKPLGRVLGLGKHPNLGKGRTSIIHHYSKSPNAV